MIILTSLIKIVQTVYFPSTIHLSTFTPPKGSPRETGLCDLYIVIQLRWITEYNKGGFFCEA